MFFFKICRFLKEPFFHLFSSFFILIGILGSVYHGDFFHVAKHRDFIIKMMFFSQKMMFFSQKMMFF